MAENSVNSTMDLTKLKVPDLKKELKSRGLSTTGNKTDLIERLQSVLLRGDGVSSESVEDLDEDLLNDDDDEHLDGNDSVINELDKKLETIQNVDKPSQKRKAEVKNVTPKKVVLNRNISLEGLEPKASVAKENNGVVESEEKKVIKLSELSAKERLEMRSKKFGVVLSTEAKKAVRAERFGGSTSSNSSNNIITSNVNTTIDVLKQRAERFGGSVSTVMSSMENQEKMEKRKARFNATTTTIKPVVTSNGLSNSEKAQLRLERFKQPVK